MKAIISSIHPAIRAKKATKRKLKRFLYDVLLGMRVLAEQMSEVTASLASI